jgi:hypothetical protein
MITCKKEKIALIYCKIVFVRCHVMNYISALGLIKRHNPNMRIDFISPFLSYEQSTNVTIVS